jgi:hypothetical protein
MKIDYVIVSSNSNPMYFDFWPIVRDLWIKVVNIKPIFIHICDEDSVIDNGDHIIHKIKAIPNVDSGLQSQIARMYITKFYSESVCLTSDIDMLPLSKTYFTDMIEGYSNDDLLIFSADAYPNIVRYPICYNAAKGKVFNDILDLDCNFETYCKRLTSYNWGWSTDELYFGKKVHEYAKQENIIKLNRGWHNSMALRRIDRVMWMYGEENVKNNEYIDSHSIRPYSKYKHEIDKLVNILLN